MIDEAAILIGERDRDAAQGSTVVVGVRDAERGHEAAGGRRRGAYDLHGRAVTPVDAVGGDGVVARVVRRGDAQHEVGALVDCHHGRGRRRTGEQIGRGADAAERGFRRHVAHGHGVRHGMGPVLVGRRGDDLQRRAAAVVGVAVRSAPGIAAQGLAAAIAPVDLPAGQRVGAGVAGGERQRDRGTLVNPHWSRHDQFGCRVGDGERLARLIQAILVLRGDTDRQRAVVGKDVRQIGGRRVDDFLRAVAPVDVPAADGVAARVAGGQRETVGLAFAGDGGAVQRQRRCDLAHKHSGPGFARGTVLVVEDAAYRAHTGFAQVAGRHLDSDRREWRDGRIELAVVVEVEGDAVAGGAVSSRRVVGVDEADAGRAAFVDGRAGCRCRMDQAAGRRRVEQRQQRTAGHRVDARAAAAVAVDDLHGDRTAAAAVVEAEGFQVGRGERQVAVRALPMPAFIAKDAIAIEVPAQCRRAAGNGSVQPHAQSLDGL